MPYHFLGHVTLRARHRAALLVLLRQQPLPQAEGPSRRQLRAPSCAQQLVQLEEVAEPAAAVGCSDAWGVVKPMRPCHAGDAWCGWWWMMAWAI